jgi:MoaA/NifB/PqqE/SkfB family radical SAM enzyme
MSKFNTGQLPSWVIRHFFKLAKSFHYIIYIFLSGLLLRNVKFKKYQNARPLGIRKNICYAPLKNMFFTSDGNVIVCCYNRSYQIGKYPEQSIKQIWEGEPITLLKKKLISYDFSLGCKYCLDTIESENYEAVGAIQYDIVPLNRKYPVIMEFETSNSCNLECIMCSSKFSSSIQRENDTTFELKNPYDTEFIFQLEEFIPHLTIAKFLGGEPFLIPLYYKIWEKIIEINPKCLMRIQTNATVLNNNIKELLSRGNFRIGVSLESFNKNTYETIRKKGDFDKVMENIKYFIQYSQQHNYFLGISVCPIQQNWKEIPEIVERCNQLNALIFFNTVINPSDCSLYHLPLDKIKEVRDCMLSANLSHKTEIEKKNSVRFNDFVNQLRFWVQQKEFIIKTREDDKQKLKSISIQSIIDDLKKDLQKYYSTHQEHFNDYDIIKRFFVRFEAEISKYPDAEYFKQAIYKLSKQPINKTIEKLKNFENTDMKELLEKILKKREAEEKQII